MLDVIIGTLLMSAGILWITHIFRASLTFEPQGRNQIVRALCEAAEKDRVKAAERKEDL